MASWVVYSVVDKACAFSLVGLSLSLSKGGSPDIGIVTLSMGHQAQSEGLLVTHPEKR